VRAKHALGKRAVVVVSLALVALVAVTTAWTSARAAAPVYLHWSNFTPRSGAKPPATTIGRARLDGTGVEQSFVSGTGRGPCGVALDRTHIYCGEALGGKVGSTAIAATKSRIAFYSTPHFTGWGQHGALYVVDADGGGKRVLSRTAWIAEAEHGSRPAWSPDGRGIAFLSVRHGNGDVYVLDLGSGKAHRVTRNPADDHEPAWSPDGRKIAFVSERIHGPSGYSYDLYVVNADGSGERRLTHDLQSASYPAWSPDGRKIAFSDGGNGIYVINADGSGQRRLGPGVYDPQWSPDGHRIAYLDGSSGTFELYVMNADGTAKHHLARGVEPSWSPDGKTIAFLHDPAIQRPPLAKENPEIYVINADGTGLRRLTNNRVWDEAPLWSPDGKLIAFLTVRNGDGEVYVMNADGSDQRSVSRNPARSDVLFDWSP
jgi:Tol biopolymer transport system component